MKTNIILIALVFLSACVSTPEIKDDSWSMSRIIKECQEPSNKLGSHDGVIQLLYGEIKQHTPAVDGYYINDPSSNYRINLLGVNDPSLLGKLVVVKGEFTALYPPGSKPERNKRAGIMDPVIIKVLKDQQALDYISEQCN